MVSIDTMNNKIFKQKDLEDYEAMQQELVNIQKAIHMVWRREQKKLVDEWLKEELK